jgi:hypothetical protein
VTSLCSASSPTGIRRRMIMKVARTLYPSSPATTVAPGTEREFSKFIQLAVAADELADDGYHDSRAAA